MSRNILITGATDGIGLAMAKRLMVADKVIAVGRSEEKLQQNFAHLAPEQRLQADLSRRDDIEDLCHKVIGSFSGLDLIIHNACHIASKMELNDQGTEMQLMVNYLAPVMITHRLRPLVSQTGGSILFINSRAHGRGHIHFGNLNLERGYGLSVAYDQSKLALMIYALHLAEMWRPLGITANSVHPGLVNTQIGEKHTEPAHKLLWKVMKQFGSSPQKAAAKIVELINSGQINKSTGVFFGPSGIVAPSIRALDQAVSRRLIQETHKVLSERYGLNIQ